MSDHFREEAGKILKYVDMSLLEAERVLDALEKLHREEVERIIGEDTGNDEVDIIKDRQRRRAGLEDK